MKRFISVLAFVLLFAAIFSKSVFAQTALATPSSKIENAKQQTAQYPIATNPDVPQNFHTYTQSVVLELLSAFSCQISGIDPLNPQGQCLGADPKTGKLGFVDNNKGAIGFITDTISMSFHIPVSSGQYIAHLTSNFGIAKPALAQEGGYGFNSLVSVLPLWEAMRNIVYVFFVLIFLFIGIGIMFRLHIDPRTVMTIQNSLPKIIMGLIFVTLSYAIAGFLVDMMYVSMYATYSVISGATEKKEIKNLKPSDIQKQNPFYAAGAIYDPNPFVGLPKLSQDAALGAVGILKNAAGIGDYQGLTDEEKKRLDATELGKPPTVTGTFGSVIDKTGETLKGFFDQLPPIPLGFGLSTSLFSRSAGSILSWVADGIALPFKIGAIGEGYGSKFIGFDNSGGDTMLGRIIRTMSVAGGTYLGFQAAQWNAARVEAKAAAGVEGGVAFDCGLCNPAIGAIVGVATAPLIDNLLRTTIPNLIGFFIVLSIVVTALLRLWFTLIKSYIYILLYVILAPFWIAFGLFPGVESAGFKPWIRGLIANLAAFPVAYAMLLFAKILTDKLQTPAGGNFVPPLIGTQQSSLFAAVFGIAILLAIPEILNIVKKALKVPEGKVGGAVSGGIGAGVGLTKTLTEPASRSLIGHKNPMTGKMAWGTLPLIGKKVGGDIMQGVGAAASHAPGAQKVGQTAAARGLGGMLSRAAQGTRNAFQDPLAREEQAREEQREKATRQPGIEAALTKGEDPTLNIREQVEIAAIRDNGMNPDEVKKLSHEELVGRVMGLGQNAKGLTARKIAVQRINPFEEIKADLIDIARRGGIKVDDRQRIQDILKSLGIEASVATSTADASATDEAPMGPPEAPETETPEETPPSGETPA